MGEEEGQLGAVCGPQETASFVGARQELPGPQKFLVTKRLDKTGDQACSKGGGQGRDRPFSSGPRLDPHLAPPLREVF